MLSQIEGYGSFINSSDFDKAIVLKLVFKLIILGSSTNYIFWSGSSKFDNSFSYSCCPPTDSS